MLSSFPRAVKGNNYAVVVMVFLTKWSKVFPTRDQTFITISRLLVEHIVPRHGIQGGELLSDRGATFLSKLFEEVYSLLKVCKTNTTAYHPQLVGWLSNLIAYLPTCWVKKVKKKNGRDWDVQLPYVLFAYHTSPHESTGESPFFLMYGRDLVLPMTDMLTGLTHPDGRTEVDFGNYTWRQLVWLVHGKLQGVIYRMLNLNRSGTMTNSRI